MPETVQVNRDQCMGSGVCIVQAPATFAHDRESKAIVLDPPHDPLDAIHAAVDGCPMAALTLTQTDTGG